MNSPLEAMAAIGRGLEYPTTQLADEVAIGLNREAELAIRYKDKDDLSEDCFVEGTAWKLTFALDMPEGRLSSDPGMLAIQISGIFSTIADLMAKQAQAIIAPAGVGAGEG